MHVCMCGFVCEWGLWLLIRDACSTEMMILLGKGGGQIVGIECVLEMAVTTSRVVVEKQSKITVSWQQSHRHQWLAVPLTPAAVSSSVRYATRRSLFGPVSSGITGAIASTELARFFNLTDCLRRLLLSASSR